jgi:hypothetical protein
MGSKQAELSPAEAPSVLDHEAIAALAQRASAAARPLAEISHIAALAADRLALGDTVSPADRRAIATMLLEIVSIGHAGFLKRSGSVTDFRDIGEDIRKRFLARGGAWRAWHG